MHLAQVGLVFIYITSHVLRREVVMKLMPIPRPPTLAALRWGGAHPREADDSGPRRAPSP